MRYVGNHEISMCVNQIRTLISEKHVHHIRENDELHRYQCKYDQAKMVYSHHRVNAIHRQPFKSDNLAPGKRCTLYL